MSQGSGRWGGLSPTDCAEVAATLRRHAMASGLEWLVRQVEDAIAAGQQHDDVVDDRAGFGLRGNDRSVVPYSPCDRLAILANAMAAAVRDSAHLNDHLQDWFTGEVDIGPVYLASEAEDAPAEIALNERDPVRESLVQQLARDLELLAELAAN